MFSRQLRRRRGDASCSVDPLTLDEGVGHSRARPVLDDEITVLLEEAHGTVRVGVLEAKGVVVHP